MSTISINFGLRFIPTSYEKIIIFEKCKQDLICRKIVSSEMNDILKMVVVEIENTSYADYKESIWLNVEIVEEAFDLYKKEGLDLLSSIIKGEVSQIGYVTLNILFYAIVPVETCFSKFCFIRAAFEPRRNELFTLINNENWRNFFTDNFLFNSTKIVIINRPDEEQFESFYISNHQVREILTRKGIGKLIVNLSAKYLANKDYLENYFMNNSHIGILLQRSF